MSDEVKDATTQVSQLLIQQQNKDGSYMAQASWMSGGSTRVSPTDGDNALVPGTIHNGTFVGGDPNLGVVFNDNSGISSTMAMNVDNSSSTAVDQHWLCVDGDFGSSRFNPLADTTTDAIGPDDGWAILGENGGDDFGGPFDCYSVNTLRTWGYSCVQRAIAGAFQRVLQYDLDAGSLAQTNNMNTYRHGDRFAIQSPITLQASTLPGWLLDRLDGKDGILVPTESDDGFCFTICKSDDISQEMWHGRALRYVGNDPINPSTVNPYEFKAGAYTYAYGVNPVDLGVRPWTTTTNPGGADVAVGSVINPRVVAVVEDVITVSLEINVSSIFLQVLLGFKILESVNDPKTILTPLWTYFTPFTFISGPLASLETEDPEIHPGALHIDTYVLGLLGGGVIVMMHAVTNVDSVAYLTHNNAPSPDTLEPYFASVTTSTFVVGVNALTGTLMFSTEDLTTVTETQGVQTIGGRSQIQIIFPDPFTVKNLDNTGTGAGTAPPAHGLTIISAFTMAGARIVGDNLVLCMYSNQDGAYTVGMLMFGIDPSGDVIWRKTGAELFGGRAPLDPLASSTYVNVYVGEKNFQTFGTTYNNGIGGAVMDDLHLYVGLKALSETTIAPHQSIQLPQGILVVRITTGSSQLTFPVYHGIDPTSLRAYVLACVSKNAYYIFATDPSPVPPLHQNCFYKVDKTTNLVVGYHQVIGDGRFGYGQPFLNRLYYNTQPNGLSLRRTPSR